jgi:hypothetical protein
MMWFWVGIPLAIVIVALVVGLPYFLTHRHLRPYERSETYAYLKAKDDVPEGMTGAPGGMPGQPGENVRRPSAPGARPSRNGNWV